MSVTSREGIGRRFDPLLMQRARQQSWLALNAIRDRMEVGISELQAAHAAAEIFAELGVDRIWHPTLIRIGANTTKTYRQKSDPNVRLGHDDSYFIDLGLVFDGHEGDVGNTFVVGHAPERQACADAARHIFHKVANAWRERGISGEALYTFADETAQAMGWQLNHAIKGHRVSDFPHSIHRGGDLGALAITPADGLWILEIQIAHRSEPFGAFYEDLLTHAAGDRLNEIRRA